jgi:hypothetical protein
VYVKESSGVIGKLDNRCWLQIGHKLLVPNVSCRYVLLRQVTVQRHWLQIRNILSLIAKFLAFFTTLSVKAIFLISFFYYLTLD